ncbi:MAG: hypothetical protein ACLGHN_04265 [Bacteriovoracia bacterium]
MSFLYAPFLLQGILMAIDEQFHIKRGLGLWERLGHPLDTLSVLIPFSYVALNSYSDSRFIIFLIMATFSSLFITKDEVIHSEVCGRVECWLHSLLFLIHPLIFVSTAILWKNHPNDSFLIIQTVFVALFLIYQILKWSIPWKLPAK